MAMTITLTLSDAQDKAFRYIAMDPQGWIESAISHRIGLIEEKLYEEAVEEALADPNVDTLPTNRSETAQARAQSVGVQRASDPANLATVQPFYKSEDLNPDSPFVT